MAALVVVNVALTLVGQLVINGSMFADLGSKVALCALPLGFLLVLVYFPAVSALKSNNVPGRCVCACACTCVCVFI